MSKNKLYIIGNGFDLQHGIKSKYWDFKKYIEDEDSELIEKLEEYFGSDNLWSDFEETLAYLDTEQIIDECLNYLEPYNAEPWSEAYHHDYQYEVQVRIDLITETLKQRFTEWILQLNLPEIAKENMVVIKKNALFINFNYTDTLERLYRVSSKNILYIHNKAINKNSTLILGHSRNPKKDNTHIKLNSDENYDQRVIEGNEILNKYFFVTYKSTETIIKENEIFFDSISKVDTIYVYGHSLSFVDKPYFEEIIRMIDKDKVTWNVSVHNHQDLVRFKEFFFSININPELIKYDRMNNFDNGQLNMFHECKL